MMTSSNRNIFRVIEKADKTVWLLYTMHYTDGLEQYFIIFISNALETALH